MATEQSGKQTSDNDNAASKPDQETLHTTDPQEHMKGPLSSLMQKTEESFESGETGDSKKKADD